MVSQGEDMTGVDRPPGEVVLAPGALGGFEISGRIEVGRGGGRGGGGRGGGGRGRGGRGGRWRGRRGGGGAVFVGPGYVVDDGPVIIDDDDDETIVVKTPSRFRVLR